MRKRGNKRKPKQWTATVSKITGTEVWKGCTPAQLNKKFKAHDLRQAAKREQNNLTR